MMRVHDDRSKCDAVRAGTSISETELPARDNRTKNIYRYASDMG